MKTIPHMETAFAPSDAPWSWRALLALWGKHLLCFLYPLSTLLFLATAPHPWYVGALFWAGISLTIYLDLGATPAKHQPAPNLPRPPFTALLYVLTVLQLANYALLIRLPHVSGFFSWDVLFGILPAGITAGYSGIVVAHELIHRRQRRFKWMGRLLLMGVLYDHWHVEHVRGHHQRVGTPEDPVTAPLGETYIQFHRRAIPAQIVSAWRLEKKRLGQKDIPWYSPQNLRNRILQGFVMEFFMLLGILLFFGFGSALLFFIQHYIAHSLLEAVNYFEHYGLVRRGTLVQPTESWDADGWFSLYSLVGLTRHSDHHSFAHRPFQELRVHEESPRLPYGYFGMVILVVFNNRKFRKMAEAELVRLGLGPFARAA